jgi:hypothetical protein
MSHKANNARTIPDRIDALNIPAHAVNRLERMGVTRITTLDRDVPFGDLVRAENFGPGALAAIASEMKRLFMQGTLDRLLDLRMDEELHAEDSSPAE